MSSVRPQISNHFDFHSSSLGDEDCLYLNIYTPNLDKNANLDVVVYIHGGAFMFNWGGLHGPDYLLDENVVFVNLNYRLGPLGTHFSQFSSLT